jgi:HEAT repeat protein
LLHPRMRTSINRVEYDAASVPCQSQRRIQKSEFRSQKTEVRSQNQEAGRRSVETTNLPEFQPLLVKLDPDQSDPETRIPNPEPRALSLFNPRLEDLLAITEDDFKRVFRDSPIKRAKYRGWLRNLCVAMGNSGDERFVPRLRDLSVHPDPIVREHAKWALSRLNAPQAPSNFLL